MSKNGWRAMGAAVAGCALALAAATVQAAPVVATAFSLCDGYGAPTVSGDGMTADALALLIFVPGPASGDKTKASTQVGAPGIAACDQALADPKLLPRFWLRRVNLLRARAMHELAAGHVAGALHTLDDAEAAATVPTDPYYRRSLGLGIDYVRAYALRKAGRIEEARALVMKTWASRPYNRQSVISARIVLGSDASQGDLDTLIRSLARQSPVAGDELFVRAFDSGRFADAAALFDGLSPPVKMGNEPMSDKTRFYLDLENNRTSAIFWAFRGGETAYALASMGRADEARAAIKRVRDNLAQATQTPSLPPTDKNLKKLAEIKEANAITLKEGTAAIDRWEALTNRRLLIVDGKIGEMLDSLKTEPLPRGPMTVELIDALIARLPPDKQSLTGSLNRLKAEARTPPKAFNEGSLGDLLQRLPDAETRDRTATYKKVGFISGPDGFTTEEHPDRGFTTIITRGTESSPAVVEELALLRAADMARKAGKKGVLVLGRKDYQHTDSNTMYGRVVATFQTGYETRIDVAFVDPAAMPPELTHAGWRVLDADEVYNTLAPIYVAKPTGKAAK